MEIFIGNLPMNASVVELRRLFGEAGRNARFRLYKKLYPDGAISCFGQADVEPERAAQSLLMRLNAAQLQGQSLEVRLLIERSYSNERRAPWWMGRPWDSVERRRVDRRAVHDRAVHVRHN